VKLSRHGRIVRWAYLFVKNGPPERTSLCAIFWLCVLWTPVVISVGIGGAAFVLLVVVSILSAYVRHWHLSVPITAVLGLAAYLGFLLWRRHQVRRVDEDYIPLADRIGAHPLIQAAFAIKHRVCPLVEIEP
jgi:cell division protein FtsW (lipid II flippase)